VGIIEEKEEKKREYYLSRNVMLKGSARPVSAVLLAAKPIPSAYRSRLSCPCQTLSEQIQLPILFLPGYYVISMPGQVAIPIKGGAADVPLYSISEPWLALASL
jgi:hypothetical protein